jgi:superfamily II DNA/RNA helicase
MTITFAQLGLPNPLVRALEGRGISEPFPVQAATIPDALAGKDVSGKAPTGSGKTLAFGLPLITRVDRADRNRPRALILAPTRELAEQIKQELTPLAKVARRYVLAVYGGVGYGPQKNALRRGVDILVATPGRLEDLIDQRSIDLSSVDIVVVDEADRMADMGFMPAVRRILDQTSRHRQTLLFSATLDGDVAVLSRDYQRDPVRHELAKQLTKMGVNAVAMHGGRSQQQRSRALQAFSTGRAQALIATDVAARGIHIEAVGSVIHFDPPHDAKDYLHRSGRTARAGATGTVVSLLTGGQKKAARRMQRDLGLDAPIEAPRFDALEHGGHRIGEPAPARPRRQAPSTRPAARPQREPRRANTNETPSVYVANLPWETTDDDVRALFGRFGEVHQTTIITDRRTGRSKGFGFVDMPEPAAASAIEALHGSDFDGRDLTVRLAKPRRYPD